MSKNILDELFGSRVRVKILKFFFRNSPSDFSARMLAERIQESPAEVRKEVEKLLEIRVLKRK